MVQNFETSSSATPAQTKIGLRGSHGSWRRSGTRPFCRLGTSRQVHILWRRCIARLQARPARSRCFPKITSNLKFASAEWQEAWRDDPSGAQKKLLVFRVEDCDRPGLLGQVVSVDLFGIDEEIARSRLLNAVRSERRKPPLPPGFPGTEPPTMPPPFPGRLIPASHHRLLVAHEELQQPELTRCQRDLRPAALHPVPTWIQGVRASGSGS